MDSIIKPNTIHTLGKPEFIGRFPVRRELEVMPKYGPTAAEEEFSEHGSIALRLLVSVDSTKDNTIKSPIAISTGQLVLVRAKEGGFYMIPLEKDGKGLFVTIREDKHRLDVVFDETRERLVVRELA